MNIKRVLTTVIGLPVVALLFVFGNKYVIDILITIIACFANYEFFKSAAKETKNISWVGYVLIFGIAFVHMVSVKIALIILTILIPSILLILFLHIIVSNMKINFKDIAFSFTGIIYIASFVLFIPLIYGIGDTSKLTFIKEKNIVDVIVNNFKNNNATGKILIWYLIWASWGSDMVAYTIGMHFGKHKFSKVSPNKTIEGCIAGVIGAILLSVIYTYFINLKLGIEIGYLKIVLISAVLCVIGQIGDFAASCIKRYFEVKDFSNIFPGHGGMIDRIDSVMFIAPYAFCVFVFFL